MIQPILLVQILTKMFEFGTTAIADRTRFKRTQYNERQKMWKRRFSKRKWPKDPSYRPYRTTFQWRYRKYNFLGKLDWQ